VVSLIERDHSSAKVSRFFSNHILGTIPPSFGGWPSAKRPRDLAFALPHPAPLRRPRAVLHGSGVARRRAWCRRAGPAGRRIFSSCPCSPPFMAAMHASSAAVRARRSASGTGIPSRASTVLTGRSGPDRSRRVSGLAASCLFRARLRMRCPGSGPAVRSSRSRLGPSRRCLCGPPLVCPSRPPVANLPSPSEPARGEPVDRRDFYCCRADREGSESPLTPHRVAARAWNGARPLPSRGEKTWSPGKRRGPGGTVAPARIIRTAKAWSPTRHPARDRGEILWRQGDSARLRRSRRPRGVHAAGAWSQRGGCV